MSLDATLAQLEAWLIGQLRAVKDDGGEDDPERDALEAQGRAEVGRALGYQLEDVLNGDLSDPDAAAGRVDDRTDELLAALTLLLIAAALAGLPRGATGPGGDATDARTAALAWAREHAGELVQDINGTSRTLVRESVAAWLQTGQPVESLAAILRPAFGEDRADLIAVTETTRALTAGTLASWRSAGVERYRWNTSGDERVCPQCGPLDGVTYRVGRGPEPPLHPRCRCWISVEG